MAPADDIDTLVEQELNRGSTLVDKQVVNLERPKAASSNYSGSPEHGSGKRAGSRLSNLSIDREKENTNLRNSLNNKKDILRLSQEGMNLSSGSGTPIGGESQMFKELFQTGNSSSKGIGGISSVTAEADKELGKSTSKTDLKKNKFSSSSSTVDENQAVEDLIDDTLPSSKKYQVAAANAKTLLKKKSSGTMQYSDFIADGNGAEEIINQHLAEEEKKGATEPDEELVSSPDKDAKEKSDSDNSDPYDYMEDSLNLNNKSPKQTLVDHLRLLSDIFNSSLDGASEYYDQIFDERAQFLLDFENILKIMTFDETVEYVMPCMQIYSCEQDYLKLKLFQNFDKLFKKMFKAAIFIPKPEIIDIITINIFPLASRMLMLSEEPV